jgi:hypothetical protein
MRNARRTGKAVALATSSIAAVAASTIATATPAAAACNGGDRNHQVQTLRSDALLQGFGKATNVSSSTERWCDFRTEEEYAGPKVWTPQVCDYQGAIYVYNPDGSYAEKSHTSSYHQGCSWGGWFYHDPLDGTYAENKRFTTKWKSDATNMNWQTIGTLVD